MRPWKLLALLTALTTLWGCSQDATPAATNAPAVANDRTVLSSGNTSFTEEDAPDFDPKLTLEWPGTPEESRRRITRGSDDTTIYSARFSQTGPVTIFMATVHQFSENELQGSDPKEILAGHGKSLNEVRNRQQIEHGPKKYMGFDVTAKSGTGFVRRVTVMVGTRIYRVEVLSLKQERLDAEDVAKFFESFAVKD